MLQKNKLDFSDFFSQTPEEWKKNILKELKTDSEEALFHLSEGITVKGFYTSHDLKDFSYLSNFHKLYELKSPRHWYNAEYIKVDSAREAQITAQNAISCGADGLYFDIRNKELNNEDISVLLTNIPLSFARIYFYNNGSLEPTAHLLGKSNNAQLKGAIIKADVLKQDLNTDVLEDYLQTINQLKDLPNLKSLGIDCSIGQPDAIKEIAYSIALAIELIDYLTEKNNSAKEVLSAIEFSLCIGKNYFIEIAKLRAFRLLWNKICEATDLDFNSIATNLHSRTSENLFTQDSNYNILQNTTEAMSAIIGGCDALTIMPSNINIGNPDEFSSRIARNISLILKEEAHLDYVVDPAGGAFMIERLTVEIAHKALQLIKEIESKGGLIKYKKAVTA